MAIAGAPSPPNPYINGGLTKWLLAIFGALAITYFTWLGFTIQEVKLGVAVLKEKDEHQEKRLDRHEGRLSNQDLRIRNLENGHSHPDRGPI